MFQYLYGDLQIGLDLWPLFWKSKGGIHIFTIGVTTAEVKRFWVDKICTKPCNLTLTLHHVTWNSIGNILSRGNHYTRFHNCQAKGSNIIVNLINFNSWSYIIQSYNRANLRKFVPVIKRFKLFLESIFLISTYIA